jgi:predicted metal-dependent hydrolase
VSAVIKFVFADTYLGKSQPLSRVSYDSKIKVIQHALGQHHYITKAHGNKTKTISEIKIASVFKNGPEAFLKMITTHELAHFQEKNTTNAFINSANI